MKVRQLIGRRIRVRKRLYVNPHANQPQEVTPLGEMIDRKIKKKEDRLELMFLLAL